MTVKPNPYQPPAADIETGSRLSRLGRLWRGFQWTQRGYFRRGGVLIIDGIAFYVDPSDSTIVFAASPSATNTPERMNLIVSEVVRVLPIFLANYSQLHRIIRGRRLVVRMIDTYADQNAVIREESIEWDMLTSFIGGASENDG